MKVLASLLPGCAFIKGHRFVDARGMLVKSFRRTLFEEYRLPCDFRETYFSRTEEGALRGLHFQVPPQDHYKLVACLSGESLNVGVDLRKGSPTYRQAFGFELKTGDAIYFPAGIAHGFCARQGGVDLLYQVSTEYAPEYDAGILWSSVGFEWPLSNPTLSKRDQSFPCLADFVSPFTYAGSPRSEVQAGDVVDLDPYKRST